MSEVYATAVMRGIRKFSAVPKTYQSAVKKILKAKVASGLLTQDAFDALIKA